MLFSKLTYKQMFLLFAGLNAGIVALIFVSFGIGKNQIPAAKPAAVQGIELTRITSLAEGSLSYRSTISKLNFQYPENLGAARFKLVKSKCHPGEQEEVVTFTNFGDLGININSCDLGILGYMENKQKVVSNLEQNLTFYVSYDRSLKAENLYLMTAKTSIDAGLPIRIIAQSDNGAYSEKFLNDLFERLIYSMKLF